MSERATSEQPELTVVGIGASAGGLSALKRLLATVPEESGLAFVIVVHLSPEHESGLAELLQPISPIPVQQVTETVALEANRVFVIPPNRNLETIDSHLRLAPLEERRRERAPIDHFFRTLSRTHDGNSAAVVLTGMGSDGTLGITEIKGRGGLTIVQDPKEAEYDGMPQSAIATGIIDLVLPLDQIVRSILRFVNTEPRVPIPIGNEGVISEVPAFLARLFAKVRTTTGRDFSHYKRSTIMRRIRRRMQLSQLEELDDYLAKLAQSPDEVRALSEDFLITVTSFFRDPEIYERLAEVVVPQIFDDRSADDPVRVWSVGCATGEEAYSVTMLLMEEAARRDSRCEIQVFASDLHEQSLRRAREGWYPGDIEVDVSKERLQRFFVKEDGAYRVRKEVRDAVVFAPHNLLSDPPFSKLDMVVCRNLLIYLQRAVQPDIIDVFHYALNPGGWLVLGTAESVDSPGLFNMDSKPHSFYRKRNVPAPEPRLPVFPLSRGRVPALLDQSGPTADLVSYSRMHQQMLEAYAPASILVSPDQKVVYFSRRAGRYIVHPGGSPTTNIFRLVRDELQIELRTTMHTAKNGGAEVRSKPVVMMVEGEASEVEIVVRPGPKTDGDGFVLVVFEERQWKEAVPQTAPVEVEELEQGLSTELDKTRQRLQSVIEEYETSQEEMRASNEELQSTNEELRSTMEELETSKEELQSINEELQTVNQENRHKVAELSQLSNDLQSLMAATHIATLFLDRQLRIMRYTPQVAELFSLRTVDRGRPLSDLTHRLTYEELLSDAEKVLEDLIPIEREVRDDSGRWFLSRMRPYRTADDRIDGIVLTFVDITKRKTSEESLVLSERRYRRLFEAIDEGFCVVELVPHGDEEVRFRVLETNPAYREHTGLRDAVGKDLRDEDPVHEGLWLEIEGRLSGSDGPVRFEMESTTLGRWFDIYAFYVDDEERRVAALLQDVTERKRGEVSLRHIAQRDAFRVVLSDALRELDDDRAIEAVACRVLGEHLGVERVTFANVVEETELRSVCDYVKGVTSLPSPLVLPVFDPRLLEDLRMGHTSVSTDVHSAPDCTPEQKAVWDTVSLRAHITVPIVEDGILTAAVAVHTAMVRSWTDAEVALVQDATERAWAAVLRARAEHAIRDSKAALEEAHRKKDEFLGVLSHELRNPLAPIMTGLHLLENTTPGSDTSLRAQAVIKRQAVQMSRLVDDLLDITRVARGKIELRREPLELNGVIRGAVDDYRSAFDGDGIVLDVRGAPGEVWVHADRVRITQAIGNLLHNAGKFTPKDGRVTVSVATEGGQAVVRVDDTGDGMREDILDSLFEPFTQAAPHATGKKSGLGLGLALTRDLVRLHDGTITALSDGPGRGSTFVVRLPLAERRSSREHGAISLPIPPRRILIIEDNVDAADSLREALVMGKHEVEVAYDGAAGLDKARSFQPQLVFCDLGLPRMDGYEVARAFAEDAALRGTPLVALSGNAMPRDRERAIDAGFLRHLAKPATVEQIEVLLRELPADR